ncbi:MAG: MoaD/ThiS family protein [Anaerolineales bacterium]|jgi:molybdopterin converting factor small subunit
MAIVVLPAPLRPYASGNKDVAVRGGSVREGLADLVRQYPGLEGHLFNEEGELRPFVHLFLDGEEVTQREDAGVTLREGSRLMLVPSIAGG